MAQNLNLRKFNMNQITFRPTDKEGPVIVLIGKRNTGKSFLIEDLLYHHQTIPSGMVISGSESGNGFYGKMVPKMFIHGEYNSLLIEQVLRRQKAVMKQIVMDTMIGHKSSIDPRLFLILDDCLFDNKWTTDKLMRCMFMNGRHWKVMLIIALQYTMGIPPILRANIDYTFILRENIKANRKRLFENYASMFDEFDVFNIVMDKCTENYECLVIHNGAQSNQITDQVFWYKAQKRPPFRLGSRQLWELSKNMEDDDTNSNYTPSNAKSVGLTINKQI